MSSEDTQTMTFDHVDDETLHATYILNMIWTEGPGRLASLPLSQEDREYMVGQLNELYARGGPQGEPGEPDKALLCEPYSFQWESKHTIGLISWLSLFAMAAIVWALS